MRAAKSFGTACAVLTALTWSSLTTVGKKATGRLPIVEAVIFTLLFSSFALGIVNLITWIIRRKEQKVQVPLKKNWLVLPFISLLAPFGYYTLILLSLAQTGASQTQLLQACWPVVMIVFIWILKSDSFHLDDIIGLVVGFVGYFLILDLTVGTGLQEAISHFQLSSLLPIGAGVVFGVFSALLTKFEHNPAYERMLFCSLFSLLFAAIVDLGLILWTKRLPDLRQIQWPALWYYFYLGVANFGLAYWLWDIAQKTLRKKTVYFTLSIPFVALLMIWLAGEWRWIKAETIPWRPAIFGLILIAAGFIITRFDLVHRIRARHANKTL